MSTVADIIPPPFVTSGLAWVQQQAPILLPILASRYIETRYSQNAQRYLTALMAECALDGDKPNRGAYIKSALTWTKNVMAFAYSTVTAVGGASTLEEALALDWSIEDWDDTDPAVTIPGALAIVD